MTRSVSIGTTTCIECGQWYETVEEAIECENLDREEREAAEEEYLREQGYAALDEQEADDTYLRHNYLDQATNEEAIRVDEYLASLHGAHF